MVKSSADSITNDAVLVKPAEEPQRQSLPVTGITVAVVVPVPSDFTEYLPVKL